MAEHVEEIGDSFVDLSIERTGDAIISDISSDAMEEKSEEIDDSFEDLLIFPTRKGLLRSTNMIEQYFALELKAMEQRGLQGGQQYRSAKEEQQAILNIAKHELSNRMQVDNTLCETG